MTPYIWVNIGSGNGLLKLFENYTLEIIAQSPRGQCLILKLMITRPVYLGTGVAYLYLFADMV